MATTVGFKHTNKQSWEVVLPQTQVLVQVPPKKTEYTPSYGCWGATGLTYMQWFDFILHIRVGPWTVEPCGRVQPTCDETLIVTPCLSHSGEVVMTEQAGESAWCSWY